MHLECVMRGTWYVMRVRACACAWKGELKKRDVRGEIIKNLIYGLGLIRMVKYSDPTHGFFYTRT